MPLNSSENSISLHIRDASMPTRQKKTDKDISPLVRSKSRRGPRPGKLEAGGSVSGSWPTDSKIAGEFSVPRARVRCLIWPPRRWS